MSVQQSRRIHITGIVQGVGFRPFVYALATGLGLAGWVRNTSAGVDIEVGGPEPAVAEFVRELQRRPPPLARIDTIRIEDIAENGFTGFEIRHSEPQPGDFIPVSPDVSLCADCERELFTPEDRRYLYPFINCTNCGPRFTIIQDIPYDRPFTTMAPFEMCAPCRAEYENPLDRRFHAQPIACPDCGPQIWLEVEGEVLVHGAASAVVRSAQDLLAAGKIVAVKGLGGFHLACDATDLAAVAELRQRKLRREKPFALMLPDLEAVEQHCEVGEAEAALLVSGPRPVVVLRRKAGSSIAEDVAPGQGTLGVMLPYTPLHVLLLHGAPAQVLVMTSGNLSEEPIAHTNTDARARLAGLADALLLHDREIHVRCDDSVLRIASNRAPYFLRRSRGYAPDPLRLPFPVPPVLAAGAELKNTFCLTRERYAFLSHHIGDLENYETLRSFEEGIGHFERLFRIQPEALAYDLHPNYLATRYALARAERDELPAIGVQHHHAHIAACLADNGWQGDSPVLGVSFDGTGYGPDGAIWGGEFLISDYNGYQRAGHLRYLPLPGGDLAVREPWRFAFAALQACGLALDDRLPLAGFAAADKRRFLEYQLDSGVNVAQTSSMGRLFDAAAALAGVRQVVNYEAQAAIEFEQLADPAESGAYRFEISPDGVVDPGPVLADLTADVLAGCRTGTVSARFHNGVAEMVLETCSRLRERTGLNQAALSGGVWQNDFLLSRAVHLLERAGFELFLHGRVPANDGGLSLGQAVIAAQALASRKE